VAGIRTVGKELNLTEGKDFVIETNVPYSRLLDYFGRAKVMLFLSWFLFSCSLLQVGLHSMWNEHFGIGIVELMAAGVITICHNSGGPKSDILCADAEGRQIGFGATTVEEYAQALEEAFAFKDPRTMQERARRAMSKFSEQSFEKEVSQLIPLVVTESKKK
jgi:glycosyltransferase involved in cell wall biosynthesis